MCTRVLFAGRVRAVLHTPIACTLHLPRWRSGTLSGCARAAIERGRAALCTCSSRGRRRFVQRDAQGFPRLRHLHDFLPFKRATRAIVQQVIARCRIGEASYEVIDSEREPGHAASTLPGYAASAPGHAAFALHGYAASAPGHAAPAVLNYSALAYPNYAASAIPQYGASAIPEYAASSFPSHSLSAQSNFSESTRIRYGGSLPKHAHQTFPHKIKTQATEKYNSFVTANDSLLNTSASVSARSESEEFTEGARLFSSLSLPPPPIDNRGSNYSMYVNDVLLSYRPCKLTDLMCEVLTRCGHTDNQIPNLRKAKCGTLLEHLVFICLLASEFEHLWATTCYWAHTESSENSMLTSVYIHPEFYKRSIDIRAQPKLKILPGINLLQLFI